MILLRGVMAFLFYPEEESPQRGGDVVKSGMAGKLRKPHEGGRVRRRPSNRIGNLIDNKASPRCAIARNSRQDT